MKKEHPLRISFTGIDGSGKSTIAGILEQSLGPGHNLVRLDRPLVSIIDGVRLSRWRSLITSITKLHETADKSRNTRLIGLASALSVFTLTRLASPYFESQYNLDLVMSNRDFLVDPSVYASIYARYLSRKPMVERIAFMRRFTGLEFRDIIFHLQVSPRAAVARIDNRIASEAALAQKPEKVKWKHLHEEEGPLRKLSDQYADALAHVQGIAGSRTQVVNIDTNQYNTNEVAALVLTKVQSSLAKLRSSSPDSQTFPSIESIPSVG